MQAGLLTIRLNLLNNNERVRILVASSNIPAYLIRDCCCKNHTQFKTKMTKSKIFSVAEYSFSVFNKLSLCFTQFDDHFWSQNVTGIRDTVSRSNHDHEHNFVSR